MKRSKRARSRKRRKQPRDDLKHQRPPAASGSRREGNDETAKGQEESDGFVVPQGRRKAILTASSKQGGKETTASKEVEQLELFRETAVNPKGAETSRGASQLAWSSPSVPKSRTTTKTPPPAMTMEAIADETNLLNAFERVASNKGAPGADRQSIEEVREYLDVILPALHQLLLEGSYRPGLIRRVWIPKPGGDQRGLGIPNVVDRVVQQAVHQMLSPHFERGFHSASHGFRRERSCHTAITEAREHVKDGYGFVVDIDLKNFFDRVHHERLLARLEHKGVEDRSVLQLIRHMLKAKVVLPDGVVVSTEEGTPQGGPLSPLLSNVVLDELDWELERRGHLFVRYADDCNIYVRSRRAGHRVMQSITRFIEKRLRLQVNTDKSAVARPTTRHFVGFRLQVAKRGRVKIRLSERSRERLMRRIVELTPRNWGGSLASCIARLNRYLKGWMSFFGIGAGGDLFKLDFVDAHIRRRLRAIILRQKKRKRHRARWLIKMGVRARTAWRTIYDRSRSLWVLSGSGAMNRAADARFFAKLGLLSLRSLWKERHRNPVIASDQQMLIPR